ncbi:hypothetical protein L218DRAFT_991826 [Marasmius fiardii PR-910]|nr:hypothetical protein L218DRAFT_991826 [Marasmius fiardii PR-910]
MLNVFHILELPEYGNGFTSSASSLLKTPTLISRLLLLLEPKSPGIRGSGIKGGPNNVVKIQIAGDFINKRKTTPVKDDRSVIKRFLKMILTREADFNRLPDTCRGIYNRCRAVVCKQGRGGDLYNDIKLELEQCMIRLARELMESNAHVQGAEWTQL